MSNNQNQRTNPYASGESYGNIRHTYDNAPRQPYVEGLQDDRHGSPATQRYGGPQQTDRYGSAASPNYGDARQQHGGARSDDRYGNSTSQGYNSTAVPVSAPSLTIGDFLARVESVKKDMDYLSESISQIAALHQRAISSPDSGSSAALENQVAQTQVLNTSIKDHIKFLETDAVRSSGNSAKDTQVRSLKNQFKSRLEQYRQEEVAYKKRYQEQIARHYKIVNPNADEREIQEAAEANWGDEGVFQTALRSNRTGAATTVLGAVRARHNDIQQIERTLIELNQLFQDLSETVQVQAPLIQEAEMQTENVHKDTENVNKQLGKSIEHARRARKLKWCCCLLVLLILLGIAIFLIIWFKVIQPDQRKKDAASGSNKPAQPAQPAQSQTSSNSPKGTGQ